MAFNAKDFLSGLAVKFKTSLVGDEHRSHVVVDEVPLATDAATQTTLVAVLDKIIAAPATAAKQPALGTAGTASTDVMSVQGIASGTAMEVSGTVTANLSVIDNTVLDNIEAGIDELKVLVGVVSATPTENTVLERLLAIETATINATVPYTVAMEPQGYETVVANTNAQALGATGATGDYLAHLLIVPATTSPGAVSIKDGAGGAITVFTGGASSVGSLVPFSIPINAVSTAGAWQVTTGAAVSAIGVGTFT